MRRPTRSLAAILALVAVTACAPAGDDLTGGAGEVPTDSTVEPAAVTSSTTTETTDSTVGGSPTTGPPEQEPAPDPNRPVAPDVSLELADGSTFVLSEQDQPVFLVFWAEW